jgi:serine protease
LYVAIDAYTTFSGASLVCTISSEDDQATVTSLTSGIWESNLSASGGDVLEYVFEPPPGSTEVICEMGQGSGDADLYVTWDEANQIGLGENVNTCRPYRNGNNETCDQDKLTPVGSVLYVSIHAYSTFSGVRVMCTAS